MTKETGKPNTPTMEELQDQDLDQVNGGADVFGKIPPKEVSRSEGKYAYYDGAGNHIKGREGVFEKGPIKGYGSDDIVKPKGNVE